jgi:hypothetical protein
MYYVSTKLKENPNIKKNSSYKSMLNDASLNFAKAIPVSLLEFIVPDELLSEVMPNTFHGLSGLWVYGFTALDDIPTLGFLLLGAMQLKKVVIQTNGNTNIKLRILNKLEKSGDVLDIKKLEKLFCEKNFCKEDEFRQSLNDLESYNHISIINQNVSITNEGQEYLKEMQHPVIKKVLHH